MHGQLHDGRRRDRLHWSEPSPPPTRRHLCNQRDGMQVERTGLHHLFGTVFTGPSPPPTALHRGSSARCSLRLSVSFWLIRLPPHCWPHCRPHCRPHLSSSGHASGKDRKGRKRQEREVFAALLGLFCAALKRGSTLAYLPTDISLVRCPRAQRPRCHLRNQRDEMQVESAGCCIISLVRTSGGGPHCWPWGCTDHSPMQQM